MNQYDKQIANAKTKIAQNGQLVIWRSVGENVIPDVNKPWLVENAVPIDRQVYMLFVPLRSTGDESERPVSDMGVKLGTTKGLIASVDFQLSSKDIVIRDGVTYEIESINSLNPSGAAILHTVLFKG